MNKVREKEEMRKAGKELLSIINHDIDIFDASNKVKNVDKEGKTYGGVKVEG